MNTDYKRLRIFETGLFTNKIKGLFTIDKPVNQSQANEAVEKDIVLLSRSTDPNYNLYKFNACGHLQFIQPTHVRRNCFTCKTCSFCREVQIAANNGFKYLFATSGTYRRVIKPCGCIKDITFGNIVDHKNTVCHTCFSRDFQKQAVKLKVDVLNKISDCRFKIRFQTCGHTREAHHSQFFTENLECQQCKEEIYRKEAENEGLIYNGLSNPDNVKDYYQKRNYTLPCGHIKDIRMSHIRDSSWQCDICKDSHFLKPSFVYLLSLNTSDGVFLKLGYAKNLSTRISGYILKNTTVSILKVVPFETGRKAIEFENSLHKKYSAFSVPKEIMGKFMQNGKTECYPFYLFNTMLEELTEGEKNA